MFKLVGDRAGLAPVCSPSDNCGKQWSPRRTSIDINFGFSRSVSEVGVVCPRCHCCRRAERNPRIRRSAASRPHPRLPRVERRPARPDRRVAPVAHRLPLEADHPADLRASPEDRARAGRPQRAPAALRAHPLGSAPALRAPRTLLAVGRCLAMGRLLTMGRRLAVGRRPWMVNPRPRLLLTNKNTHL